MKKVVRVVSMIHQGSMAKRKIKALEVMIKQAYANHFNLDVKLVFIWMTIPNGQAYLGGKPSTASTLQVPVEDKLPNELRHPFMHEICVNWMEITGCNKNEIILNSPDFSEADIQLERFNSKFNPLAKGLVITKMFGSLLIGKARKGYLTTSVNN